jgi:hypothetical protein
MVKKGILAGIFIFVTLACSFFSPKTDFFENDAFSFRIPKDWLWGGDDEKHFGTAQRIVGIRNPQGLLAQATFTIVTFPLTGGTQSGTLFSQVYEELVPNNDESKKEFNQGGLSGFELSYSHPNGEAIWAYRDIWLEKDSVLYVLSFRACCNSYDTYANTFDQILNSFRFKE